MRKGEKGIFGAIAAVVIVLIVWNVLQQRDLTKQDTEIPFYTTASAGLRGEGSALYRRYECKRCHTLWTVRDMLQAVPAPALDGIGSLHDESWFYRYLSAEDPQAILPSRLKPEYRMPSFAHIPEQERRTLAAYLASLKVEDWYLEDAKRDECSKLTGRDC